MNQQYKELHRQARSLEFKLKDKIDNKRNPLSGRLLDQFRSFVDNIESEKSPRTLESQAKQIIDLLHSCSDEGDDVMDYTDLDFFEDAFEDIIKDLREFDNH